MAEPIIRVENLSKSFVISHENKERYTALRDVVSQGVRNIFSKKTKATSSEEFWALKDLNFEIKQGDRVGIIGRNGAGKSTLLKVLSRITEPTTGRVTIDGRVASLLEVGTGFHPELTGRENIFLNGAILGMSRAEIRSKFDEIVAFAEVEKFLDTPVKRYSSGMYVRLAFAVAAHLEPEILIVDEVLAVGDAQFQKKCLGKMKDVSEQGRTVLFVSHNIVAISQLCNSALLLSNGRKVSHGPTNLVVSEYLDFKDGKHVFLSKEKDIYFTSFNCQGEHQGNIAPDQACLFEFKVFCGLPKKIVHLAFGVNDKFGNRLFTPYSRNNNDIIELKMGENIIVCEVEKMLLKPDVYYLHLYVGDGVNQFDYVSEGISIEVIPLPFYHGLMPDESHGPVLVRHKWKTK